MTLKAIKGTGSDEPRRANLTDDEKRVLEAYEWMTPEQREKFLELVEAAAREAEESDGRA